MHITRRHQDDLAISVAPNAGAAKVLPKKVLVFAMFFHRQSFLGKNWKYVRDSHLLNFFSTAKLLCNELNVFIRQWLFQVVDVYRHGWQCLTTPLRGRGPHCGPRSYSSGLLYAELFCHLLRRKYLCRKLLVDPCCRARPDELFIRGYESV
jgi:hypothetical protein